MRTIDTRAHARRRDHILDAAAMCFADRGYAKTTIAQICAAAEISSGSLFHYFPNKHAVFTAIFERDREEVDDFFATATDIDDPYGRITAWIHRCAEQAQLPIITGLQAAVLERSHQDPEFAKLVHDTEIRSRDGLAILIRRAAHLGQITEQPDPALSAAWLLVLVDGLYNRLTDLEFDLARQLSSLDQIVRTLLGANAPPTRPDRSAGDHLRLWQRD